MEFRVILYHKQATSARTRFVRFGGKTVFASGPVEALSQVNDSEDNTPAIHPAAILKSTENALNLPQGCLKSEAGFQHSIEVPGANIPVVLACIETMDPPFEEIEQAQGQFIDLTQARGLPPVELELLRHAYELVLGG